jgi:hypothetical protein
VRKNFFSAGLLVGAALLPVGVFGWAWDAAYRHDAEAVGVGSKYGHGKEEISLAASEKIGNGTLSFGLEGRILDDSSAVNRVAAHVDCAWDVAENWHLSVGYQPMRYFRCPVGIKMQGNEVHASLCRRNGLSLNGEVSYNFDEEDFGLYFSATRSAGLASIGLDCFSIRSVFSFGYDHCAKPGGVPDFFQKNAPGDRCGFFYYGVDGDLVYKLPSLPGSLFVGCRYAGNSASRSNWNNALGNHRNLLWAVLGGALQF